MSEFFKFFNSLQITALFAGFPFFLMYLHSASFAGHQIALWIAGIVYFIFFCCMIGCVLYTMDSK